MNRGLAIVITIIVAFTVTLIVDRTNNRSDCTVEEYKLITPSRYPHKPIIDTKIFSDRIIVDTIEEVNITDDIVDDV